MTYKRYLVKLTPHATFFFGGERSFGGVDGQQANYMVQSNYFPQQTGILGLIRHQLLLQNGCIVGNGIDKSKKVEAGKLIGEKSFRIGEGPLGFGLIQKISPVFVSTPKNDFLFPANKEYQLVTNNQTKEFVARELSVYGPKASLDTDENEQSNSNTHYYLKDYDPKDGLPDLLFNKNGSIRRRYDCLPEDDGKLFNGIFIKNTQTGIHKNYAGVTEEKAYYIQTSYRLVQDYSFAFLVELKDEPSFNFGSQPNVIFGGEQSAFKMEVSEFAQSFDDIKPQYEKTPAFDKLTLLSDAFVQDNRISDVSDFTISDAVDFRCLTTSVRDTNNYADLPSDGKKSAVWKSEKLNLLKKGSVFFGDTVEIEKCLKEPNFEMIGYNQYTITKG